MASYIMENPLPKDNPKILQDLKLWCVWKKQFHTSWTPANQHHWNEIHQLGNPTIRAQIPNWLLSAVCWEETYRVGKAAQSDWPFTDYEMEQVLDGFRQKSVLQLISSDMLVWRFTDCEACMVQNCPWRKRLSKTDDPGQQESKILCTIESVSVSGEVAKG